MKHFTSLLLTLTLLLSITIPATASECTDAEDSMDSLPQSLIIASMGHGEYEIASNKTRNARSNYQHVVQTPESSEVYEGNGQSFLYCGQNKLQAVEKNNLASLTISDIDTLSLPTELASSIKQDIEKYGNINGFVFTPTSKTATFTPYATTAPSYYRYSYKEQSYYMQQYLYVSTNLGTGYKNVATGITANTVASTLVSLTMNIAGQFSKRISLVGSGVSVLQDLKTVFGVHTVSGSTQDLLQSRINYDKNEKYTYVNDSPAGDGNYLIGSTSGQVVVRTISTYQYYINNGNALDHTTTVRPNTYVTSPNYADPNGVSIQHHNTSPLLELPITGAEGGLTITF